MMIIIIHVGKESLQAVSLPPFTSMHIVNVHV